MLNADFGVRFRPKVLWIAGILGIGCCIAPDRPTAAAVPQNGPHLRRVRASCLGSAFNSDDETWNAFDLLAKDRMQDFQELADEVLSDLLRKHGRPTDLKTALRQSPGAMDQQTAPLSERRRGRGKTRARKK
jgi:hypothetical protein